MHAREHSRENTPTDFGLRLRDYMRTVGSDPREDPDFSALRILFREAAKKAPWPDYFPGGWTDEQLEKEFSLVRDDTTGTHLYRVAEVDHEVRNSGTNLVGIYAALPLQTFVDARIPELEERLTYALPVPMENALYQMDIITHPGALRDRGLIRHLRAENLPMVPQQLFEEGLDHAATLGAEIMVTRTPPFNTIGINFFTGERLMYNWFMDDIRDTSDPTGSPENRRYFWRPVDQTEALDVYEARQSVKAAGALR